MYLIFFTVWLLQFLDLTQENYKTCIYKTFFEKIDFRLFQDITICIEKF